MIGRWLLKLLLLVTIIIYWPVGKIESWLRERGTPPKVALMWVMLIASVAWMVVGLGYCWWIILTQWK